MPVGRPANFFSLVIDVAYEDIKVLLFNFFEANPKNTGRKNDESVYPGPP